MPDYVHLLVSILPKLSVSSFMGHLKGKSAFGIVNLRTVPKRTKLIVATLQEEDILQPLINRRRKSFWHCQSSGLHH